jgi:hypothetical protein
MQKNEEHFQIDTYGAVFQFTPEVVMMYGQILMMIVGADGEVSAAEWAYLSGRARSMGIPHEVIEAWRAFDHARGDLVGTVRAFNDKLGASSYAFLYDAVKVARADHYHEAEKRATRVAAAAAGISEAIVGQIEKLVEAEDALRTLRISLLYPHSSVFHATPPA